MNRFIVMGLITLVLVILIFTYNPNGKYLAVYNGKATISYNIESGYNLTTEVSGDSLKFDKKENDNNSINWVLFPKSDGKATIKYTYKKDDSDDIIYTVIYEFKVEDNKIYWVNGKAIGLLDFPNPK